ncbi:NAD(P)-binding protein [Pholiota molesta]|nr:NAD(P)-binding protein [Pholiota molesta]
MAFSFFSQKAFSEDDLADLHGRVVIITGGNSGVGYGTVQWLARKGAKVYIAGRNEERVSAAIKQLESEGIEDGSLHFLKTDLADPRLAKQAGEEFLQKETRLDILVNNAAIGATGPYDVNKDGLKDIMATNHIGHFVLTETLLPLLKTTAQLEGSDVRIVNISSVAHTRVTPESFVGKETLNKDYGNSINGYLDTYGLSKLANILHIKTLQKHLDAENVPITCLAVHPGAVISAGFITFLNSVPYIGRFAAFIGPWVFTHASKGSRTSAFAAAGKKVQEERATYKGAYLVPVAKLAEPSSSAKDERLARELDETTREVLKELGV